MTLEELRAKYPDELAQAEAAAAASADHTAAVQAAVEAERKRMSDIDEVACLLDPNAVREAKYGEHPCTAESLLMAEAKKAAQQGKKFLTAMQDDAKTSGAGSVPAAPDTGGTGDNKDMSPEMRMANARAAVHNLLHKPVKEE